MAITSIGYAGTVNAAQWAQLAPRLGEFYSVDRFGNSYNASVAGGDRAIRISEGTASGFGITDANDSAITVTHAAASSGVRYDMIVLRRNWSTKLTTLAVVQGTSTRQVPARTRNPGTIDDQPLWLIRITAGSTVPVIEADLRLFNGHGGLAANSDLVLQYINTVGTRISIGSNDWTLPDETNWHRSSNEDIAPGIRPFLRLQRIGVQSLGGSAYVFGGNGTAARGEWASSMSYTPGSSEANPAMITFKTAGVYAIAGQVDFDSGFTYYAHIFPVVTKGNTPNGPVSGSAVPNGWQKLFFSDTQYIEAGGTLRLSRYSNITLNILSWHMQAMRISD